MWKAKRWRKKLKDDIGEHSYNIEERFYVLRHKKYKALILKWEL